jgi:formylglycine-generating enzyme required for sulfatase activity
MAIGEVRLGVRARVALRMLANSDCLKAEERIVRPGNIVAGFGGASVAHFQSAARVAPMSRAEKIGIELIPIPAGECVIQGTANVFVGGFRLGKTPVTNGQYKIFIEKTGHRNPIYWHDEDFGIEAGTDLPVVGVSP